MAYEMRDNSGNLFKNQNKRHEKQPDFTGVLMVKVDGMQEAVKMNISGWQRESKAGNSYVNLKIDEYGKFSKDKSDGEEVPF